MYVVRIEDEVLAWNLWWELSVPDLSNRFWITHIDFGY